MKLNEIAKLLREFDYDKNGEELTIQFLITMLYELYGLK